VNELELNRVIERLRPSFATIISIVDECLSTGIEKEFYLDQEYKVVAYIREPLGMVLVHLRPHLEGDKWAKVIQRDDIRLFEPSIKELRAFYRSHLRILCVCAKASNGYWMNIIVKTKKTTKGVESEAKIVELVQREVRE